MGVGVAFTDLFKKLWQQETWLLDCGGRKCLWSMLVLEFWVSGCMAIVQASSNRLSNPVEQNHICSRDVILLAQLL
jgi:hypothetical protein